MRAVRQVRGDVIKEKSVLSANDPPGSTVIDAEGLDYRELNRRVRQAASKAEELTLEGVCGQRYIGSGIRKPILLKIKGVPGNDLGSFMDGPRIFVYGNAQDGLGNTMNDGLIVVHGRAGDIAAMGMRGGRVYIRDGVGYRCAIHMKEYGKMRPILVIGGGTQDFLGEYMAGGVVLVLRLPGKDTTFPAARHLGTGIHGGRIFVRGPVSNTQLGKGAALREASEEELREIESLVRDYVGYFGGDAGEIMDSEFNVIFPKSRRPFGGLYAY